MTTIRKAAQLLEDLQTLKVITSDNISGTISLIDTRLNIYLSIPEFQQERIRVVKNAFFQEFGDGTELTEILDDICISILAN